jgi:hypothetical protein
MPLIPGFRRDYTKERDLCVVDASGVDAVPITQLTSHLHPHPCVSPGGEVVVFDSDRTGVPHIYAAHVPEHYRDDLAS